MAYERKELPETACRPEQKFNQAPTGHRIPEGRSKDDPAMEFRIPDCAHRAFGQFSYPFAVDECDLPADLQEEYFSEKDDFKRNNQGF